MLFTHNLGFESRCSVITEHRDSKPVAYAHIHMGVCNIWAYANLFSTASGALVVGGVRDICI